MKNQRATLRSLRALMLGSAAGVLGVGAPPLAFAIENEYLVECFGADGSLKWSETVKNRVVNEGLDEILDQFWGGSAYTASHFVGLTDGTPTTAAGDTMSSHAGWAEVHSQYSEGTREALTMGAASGQSISNSASKAQFNFTGGVTIGGFFVSTNSTKNGTTGILIGVTAFDGGDRAVVNTDIVNVTVTSTMATV
jgi:hypothetical protein